MYAVVNIGGKQAKVEVGSLVAVEKIDAKAGEAVSLPVLMIADGERVLATPAELGTATVTADVLEHFKGEKQIVFKFKKRKGYKRTRGHRQNLTSVRVVDISLGGSQAAAAPKAVAAPVAATAPVGEGVAASATCAALKSDGTPCMNKPKEGSRYCGVHAKKYEG